MAAEHQPPAAADRPGRQAPPPNHPAAAGRPLPDRADNELLEFGATAVGIGCCLIAVATGLAHGPADLEPEEQDLRHRWFPRGEVEEMIRSGITTDDSTLAAYTLFLLSERSERSPAT